MKYGRIMSRVKWTPVADTMPSRRGTFQKGTEYTGVPYSSVKEVGRYIGFDIYLKTFLAAVENPESVLYTENLRGVVSNAESYYGKVCSSYTSYALQCGIWYLSRVTARRDGLAPVLSQSAQDAQPGDLIFRPPGAGSHIELVTEVTRNAAGDVTHVRVEESRPPVTTQTNYTAADFDVHVAQRNRVLLRIHDLDAWRKANKAEDFLFPNYAEDSKTPTINRTLLLDRGDWVVYRKGQPVKFNIMDRDNKGVKALVIKRGAAVEEVIDWPAPGVIERTFAACADYTAHCVMVDGSESQACEFSVGELELELPSSEVQLGTSWELEFSAENLKPIILYFRLSKNGAVQPMLFPDDAARRAGKITVPAGLLQDAGGAQVWLIAEGPYGRLKLRKNFVLK